jgi:hypothetical protein
MCTSSLQALPLPLSLIAPTVYTNIPPGITTLAYPLGQLLRDEEDTDRPVSRPPDAGHSHMA